MSVVKINALTVPAERFDEIQERFAGRAGMVDQAPGFERFQLLRPTGDSQQWFVVTQWESEQAFQDWMQSRAFAKGHADAGGDGDGDGDAAQSGGDAHPGSDAQRAGDDATPGDPAPRGSAATGAELLEFEVVQESS